jgi:pyruvate/oxaloacetate carboxyltransferase
MAKKRKIKLLDETLRNAQQSLWATRMRTESMLPIADVIGRAGYDTVCVGAGVSFESAAMFLQEDHWERMRLLKTKMPHMPFDVLVRARNLWGWTAQPYDVQTLFLEVLQRNGVDGFKLFDGLNDLRNMEYFLSEGNRLGFAVKVLLGYNESPAHTDAYLATKAKQFVDAGAKAIILSDSPGVMLPDRAYSSLSAVRKAIGETELHFHCHTSSGQGRAACAEAIRAGTDVFWTASRPLAWGSALPDAIAIVEMAEAAGCETDMDREALEEIADWFYWVAYKEGRKIPEDKPFDADYHRRYSGHQIPGGMISNLVQQLADRGMSDRLDEVLEEAGRVRRELGYPHMSTPFSQFVGVQALMNVVQGKRYASPPEALQLYARGGFGETIAAMDQNVKDRLSGGAEDLDPLKGLDDPILPRIRSEYGPFDSDEDLLMFLFLHPAAYQDFRAHKKPIVDRPRPHPVVCLAQQLASSQSDVRKVHVRKGDDIALDFERI